MNESQCAPPQGAGRTLEGLRERLIDMKGKLEKGASGDSEMDSTLDDAIELVTALMEGQFEPPSGEGWVRFDPESGSLFAEVGGQTAQIRIGIEDIQIMGDRVPGSVLTVNAAELPAWMPPQGSGSSIDSSQLTLLIDERIKEKRND